MNIVQSFLKYLRIKRNFYACDEVMNYGCIADILAVDKKKKRIYEFEFKSSSSDLIHAEKKKTKYQPSARIVWRNNKPMRVGCDFEPSPNYFYYVIPQELYDSSESVRNHIENENCGCIVYWEFHYKDVHRFEFCVKKSCKERKSNVQKYDVALESLVSRLSRAYAMVYRSDEVKEVTR